MDHLIKIVIPLELNQCIPSQPLINISSGLSNDYKLGIETALEYKDERFNVKIADEIRVYSEEEPKRRESQHETD